jgi:hypothetical protein
MATNPTKQWRSNTQQLIITLTDGCHNTFASGDSCTGTYPEVPYIECVNANFCNRQNYNVCSHLFVNLLNDFNYLFID